MSDAKTKIERAWKLAKGGLEPWKSITEDEAKRELANAHGGVVEGLDAQRNAALVKLQKGGALDTRFGSYRIS